MATQRAAACRRASAVWVWLAWCGAPCAARWETIGRREGCGHAWGGGHHGRWHGGDSSVWPPPWQLSGVRRYLGRARRHVRIRTARLAPTASSYHPIHPPTPNCVVAVGGPCARGSCAAAASAGAAGAAAAVPARLWVGSPLAASVAARASRGGRHICGWSMCRRGRKPLGIGTLRGRCLSAPPPCCVPTCARAVVRSLL